MLLHFWIFYKCFIDNDTFLTDFEVQMVAIPKNVDISGRKAFNPTVPATQLTELSGMSMSSRATLEYLRQSLAKFQVALQSQAFEAPLSLTGNASLTRGENFFAVVEGRKNPNLECFVLSFDACRLA